MDFYMLIGIIFGFWIIFVKKYNVAIQKNVRYSNSDCDLSYIGMLSLISSSISYMLICFLLGTPQFVTNSIVYYLMWGIIAIITYCIMETTIFIGDKK